MGNSTTVITTYVLIDAGGTITFSTGIGIADGKIVVKGYDAVNKTVTGTFKFNAENILNNPLVGRIMSVQFGIFRKYP